MDAALINLTTGPLLIYTVINWGLFGILSLQVYLFSQAFPNDRLVFKAMVYGMYFLETAQIIALTVSAWATFVEDFGHDISLSTFRTISASVCFFGAPTAVVAQTFYAYRIMIISGNKMIPSFIILMSLTSFIAEIVFAISVQQMEAFEAVSVDIHAKSAFVGVWTGTGCTCDIVIAACMCFYLSRRIQDGTVPKTQALVSRAMRMTIETGALTGKASVSIVSLAMFYAPTLDGFKYYTVPISALAKLHGNTMLALLNSRIKLKVVSESTTWLENELPPISLSGPRHAGSIGNMMFASVNTSDNGIVVQSKDDVIAIEEAEMTFSARHSYEGIANMEHTA